jgi:hypothetical protein
MRHELEAKLQEEMKIVELEHYNEGQCSDELGVGDIKLGIDGNWELG